jgi:ABC-2 type transport system ATP-binding protein
MPANGSALAIELRGVRKSYESTVAVDALDLRVPRGSTYGLLGPNGSGKTTTIRLVLGILAADRGEVHVLGGTATPEALDRIGYLPEERGLYRRMKVRRLLLFLAELKGMGPADARPRIDAWLERLGLADRGEARVHELSKGMQQKLQFLAAVLHEPELVILDEPFAGLDPINQETLKTAIGELRSAGRTVLLSTHQLELAERLCDQVCIIARGRAVADGPIAEVRRGSHGTRVALALETWSPETAARIAAMPGVIEAAEDGREIEIALAEGADPQALLAELVRGGARIQRFERVQPTLRQVFLERAGGGERPGRGQRAGGMERAGGDA